MSDAPQSLKIGDRVRLRSGGPLMVVAWTEGYCGEGRYLCRWFDQAGHVNSGQFDLATLQVIEGTAHGMAALAHDRCKVPPRTQDGCQ